MTLPIGDFWEMPHYLLVQLFDATIDVEDNFTISLWVKPQGVDNSNVISIGGQAIAYTATPLLNLVLLDQPRPYLLQFLITGAILQL